MTFKERFQAGDCTMNMLEDLTELWLRYFNDRPLDEFLGLDDRDSHVWTIYGTDWLAHRLSRYAYPRFTGIRVLWGDLERLIKDTLLDMLGHKYSVGLELKDTSNWKVVFQIEGKVNEGRSRHIIQRLGLNEINLDHFVEHRSITSNQAKGLLSKMFHREVSHVLADYEGVWILHKAYQMPEEGKVFNLVSRYERRLQQQIVSLRYPAVNQETAAHQLFGFVKSLEMLGFVEKDKYLVQLDHFSKDPEQRLAWPDENELMR